MCIDDMSVVLQCGHFNPDVEVWGGPNIRRALADNKHVPIVKELGVRTSHTKAWLCVSL